MLPPCGLTFVSKWSPPSSTVKAQDFAMARVIKMKNRENESHRDNFRFSRLVLLLPRLHPRLAGFKSSPQPSPASLAASASKCFFPNRLSANRPNPLVILALPVIPQVAFRAAWRDRGCRVNCSTALDRATLQNPNRPRGRRVAQDRSRAAPLGPRLRSPKVRGVWPRRITCFPASAPHLLPMRANHQTMRVDIDNQFRL